MPGDERGPPRQGARHAPGAGCEKVGTGFSRQSRSKILESITFYDFELIQSKIIVI
jgi:hypothetical protein